MLSPILPRLITPLVILLGGLLVGCASSERPVSTGIEESPTVSLLRGETEPDEFLREIERNNVETREQEQFEMNREDTRVYNTVTKRWEFMEPNSGQVWDEAEQRWEYTPSRGEN